MSEETPLMPPAPLKEAQGNEQFNAMSARIRIGEERNSELRKKLLFIEQAMLANNKKALMEIKSLQGEVSESRRTIQEVEDRIISIIKELRLTARKEDFDVLKRYIELWNPAKFITHDKVEELLKEQMPNREEKPPRYDSP